MTREKGWHYPDFSTPLHLWEVWNLGWEKKVWLFHTSTPQRSVELRIKKESRDLVASAGHLWIDSEYWERLQKYLGKNHTTKTSLEWS